MKNKMLAADLSLLFVALIWGAGFVATKEALYVAKPFYTMFIRFTLSFLLMLLVFHKKVKNIDKTTLKNGSIIALFLFMGFGTQTIGLQFTTAGKQAFLTGTNVVIVPFLYWALTKKRPDIYSIFSAFLCVVGIAFLTLENGIHINIGDTLTLFCAFFFAGHIVAVGHFTKKTDPIALTIVQLGVSAVFSFVFALVLEPAPTNFTLRGTVSLLYLGIFSTLLAFLIQNLAQKHTTSTHAAIILCTEAVFGSVLSVIILNEPFTTAMIVGCIIIFISILISETKLEFLKFKKQTKVENEI